MGKLTNLNPLTDNAALNAHVNATDPHPQYATQARADERYGAIKKILFNGTTASTEGASLVIPHGLIFSKIQAINALLEHSPGLMVTSGTEMTVGYMFNLSLSSTSIFVGNVPSKSFKILSKPIKIIVDYLLT
jgi:hypothetical protein